MIEIDIALQMNRLRAFSNALILGITSYKSLVLYLLLLASFANAQYTVIPTSTTFDIFEIEKFGNDFYVNSYDGYLGKYSYGSGGVDVLTSPNVSWDYIQRFLNVIDTNQLLITSHHQTMHIGYVFKSDDGGNSWITILDSTQYYIKGMIAFDSLKVSVPSINYDILRTSNGGLSWSVQNLTGLIVVSAQYKLNDSVAYIGVLERMSYTQDAGETWSGISYNQKSPTSIFALNTDSLFVTTYHQYYAHFCYNFNPGPSMSGWQCVQIDIVPTVVKVRNSNEIYIGGYEIDNGVERKMILRSTDLGQNWERFDFNDYGRIYDIEFINDTVALVAGSFGFLCTWDYTNSSYWLANDNVEINSDVIQVYPNPIENLVTVSASKIIKEIEVVDLTGITVLSRKANAENLSFSVENLSTGAYVLRVYSDDNSVLVKKILIDK